MRIQQVEQNHMRTQNGEVKYFQKQFKINELE